MAKNVKKNVNTTANLTPFTKDYQPSPKAKSDGWKRRREGLKLMNQAKVYLDMKLKQVKDIRDDMKVNPDKYTMREVKVIDYILNNKYMVDLLDRHISKAPVEVKHSGEIGVLTSKDIAQLKNAR